MSTKDQRTKHFLFSGVPAWGHIRPFCILAARLVNENEHVVVTMLIAPKLLDKAQSEVTAEFNSSRSYSEDARQRVRILSTFQSASNDTLSLMTTLAETYTSTYQALTEGKEITCAVKGTVFAPVPAPSVLILDFVALPQLHATRAISGQSVPIVAWITGHAATRLRMFGPESMGGLGDVAGKTEAEAARLGVTPEEVGHKFVRPTEGEVVSLPGLPPMFDYEFYPQKRDSPPLSLKIYRGCYTVLKECDDVMVAAPEAFEKEPLNAMRTWFSDWKKDTFPVGPLLPLNYGTETKHLGSAVDAEIEAFLDHKLELHGEKSVLFMSFGTLFWPATPEYVEETIDALIEKKFPFIFCYASPRATISDELAQKVKDSHLGILTPWAPQQFILNHPATGWFLTHCGQNSVTEALSCGVPMIAWPFESDQPVAAALLSEILKVAIELIEVRTGEYGLKPLRRNGRAAKGTREAVGAEIRQVLDECRGQKGAELRKNAESMKAQFVDAWKDDGVARKELRRFLAKYL